MVNTALAKHNDSKHIRVNSVPLSKAGNFVIITRDDTNGSDLLHMHKFAKALTQGQEYKAVADLSWFRVRLIGVPTPQPVLNEDGKRWAMIMNSPRESLEEFGSE